MANRGGIFLAGLMPGALAGSAGVYMTKANALPCPLALDWRLSGIDIKVQPQ